MKFATLNLNLDNVERKFQYRQGTNDELVIVQALKSGAYKFGQLRRAKELSELYGRLLMTDKVPLIIDAGANIGASTIYFAFAFPKAHLVAIEPEPSNFRLLAANTADLPVDCLHTILAASAEISNVANPGNGFAGYRATLPTDSTNSTPALTRLSINEIYQKNAQTALPFIVKIDIERCDGELFSANTEWVNRTPIIITQLSECLIPGTNNTHAFVEYVADQNRDFVYLHDSIFSINHDLNLPHASNSI